jgi:Poly(hydroxyalcanoate) granule associated protein (phasin)
MAKLHSKAKLEPGARVGLGRSAHDVWLAGLGALAQGREEGSRLFSRLVIKGREVERKGGGVAAGATSKVGLGRIQQTLDLNLAELGRLFGVSRQAASSWLAEGVPSARVAKLVTVLEVVDLLSRQLKPGRLPGVARKPAAAYGGLSMLELIAADRQQELLELVRRSFDWAATA